MRRASFAWSPVSAWKNSSVPDFAMVPMLATTSSRDMPTPLSEIVMVRASLSKETRILRSASEPYKALLESASKRSLSAASEAFETSSLRKISLLPYKEWIMRLSSCLTSAWKPRVSFATVTGMALSTPTFWGMAGLEPERRMRLPPADFKSSARAALPRRRLELNLPGPCRSRSKPDEIPSNPLPRRPLTDPFGPARPGPTARRGRAGHLGRRGHRISPGERPENPADPRPLGRYRHGQRHLPRRLAARRLRRDRNGASPGASHVPRHAALPGHQGGFPEARSALQRQHLVRPDQLLRNVPREREDTGLRARCRSRPHGQRLHRPARPRRGNDGGAQRVRGGGKQRLRRAARTHGGKRLSLAQLRKSDHRGALGHRERADRAAPGVLHSLLPAGQRGAAAIGQARGIDRAQARAKALRKDPQTLAHAAHDLHRRADPGRRARGDAAARGG